MRWEILSHALFSFATEYFAYTAELHSIRHGQLNLYKWFITNEKNRTKIVRRAIWNATDSNKENQSTPEIEI